MLLILFGRRMATLGKYTDNDHICYPCKAFEREVRVYRPYFHFCYIPVFPIGPKQFEVRCTNCGDKTPSENLIRKYERRAKTPFYLYSAIILSVAITAYWFYWNNNNQKHKAEFVGNPVVDDVYIIKEDADIGKNYYFLRIAGVRGDTVVAFHSNLQYNYFVTSLSGDDYFVKADTTIYLRKQLKDMLEGGEIYMVKRGYGDGGGFNRIR
jgi:hypothetical protein